MKKPALQSILERIATAVEQLTPHQNHSADLETAPAYIWQADSRQLIPVPKIRALALNLILDINHNVEVLHTNTLRFAKGLPANNALLWGARGMGKSSIIKAITQDINITYPGKLALVELHRDDLKSLPYLLAQLEHSTRRFILFCDDLSFSPEDDTYKSLKVLLDGSVAGQPNHVIMYATSNSRHIVYEASADNQHVDALHPTDAIEEKVSLSDRFGLWLGFYHCSEQDYLKIVDNYSQIFKLEIDQTLLHQEAKQWAITRGNRSGRVAWQYITDLAGRQEKTLHL